MTQRRVLFVGGGIISLASAFRLARQGHHVSVIDPTPGHGATWAAAGMIAPSAEIAPGEEANYRLQCGALGAWYQLSDELAEVLGRGVSIHETGTLLSGWDAGDRRLVAQFTQLAEQFDAPMRPVTRQESPEVFEGLSPRMNEGVIMSGDAWLDPDEAVAQLRAGLLALGGEFVTESAEHVGSDSKGVLVRTATQTLQGDLGLLATGSTPLPEGAQPGGQNVIRPVRGITVRVEGFDRSSQPMVRAFVHGRIFYMVSRPGGYCVLGATSDERAELAVEFGELQRLLRDALDIAPALETTNVTEIRYGLRPTSADHQPFFETIRPQGWAWVSGHYRHGVTLAPLATRDVLDYVNAAT